MEDALAYIENASATSVPVELTWSGNQEVILAEWADQANCFRWMHVEAEKLFMHLNYGMTLTVLTIATILGTVTFGLDSLFDPSEQRLATICIGTLSLLSGLLTTVALWLRVPQLQEAHRMSAVQWGKLHRVVSVELSLRRDQRVPSFGFLRITRLEMDRLLECSPTVPDLIVRRFRVVFASNTTVCKPDIVNGLEHTETCRESPPRAEYGARDRTKRRAYVHMTPTSAAGSEGGPSSGGSVGSVPFTVVVDEARNESPMSAVSTGEYRGS